MTQFFLVFFKRKMRGLIAFVLTAVLLVNGAVALKKGILGLDEINFDKIVDGSRNVLVEIVEYSWKATNDYEKVAEEFKNNNDVIVALLEFSDNKDFVKSRFGIEKSEDLPKIKFFPAGKKEPEDVSTDDPDGLIEFVHSSLNSKLGTLKSMVKEFMASDNKAELLKRAEDYVKKELAENVWAKYYINSMQKIVEKGADFVKKEKERLQNLVTNSKSAAKTKLAEFKKRLTVLHAFDAEKKNIQP
jgi:protein disulfide-isomerase A6